MSLTHITSEKLHQTQQCTNNVRNICIIAHVDHGKTTLSDFLVSSNGIISTNLAGKMRYMDSTAYEQEKRITMKSSAICLLYRRKEEASEASSSQQSNLSTTTTTSKDYVINLIDSPGHVDFSSEVSTAARLSDGCLVLVDVVEGVCTQTRTVLEQAFREHIKPCLVLNKIDRLILEKQMTPMEAYRQMLHILQQVNVLMTTFVTAQLFKKINTDEESQNNNKERTENSEDATKSTQVYSNVFDEYQVDSNDFFSPQKGNVLFASAYDGWGFRINEFADLFAKKMGMNKNTLQQTLWGDCYLNAKKKTISKKPLRDDQPNMFVQFILQNIYNAYDCVLVNRDEEKIKKMIQSLELNLSKAFLSKNDHKTQLKTLMNQWLPLSDSILEMVVTKLPNPQEAQRERILDLIPELKTVDENESAQDNVPLDGVASDNKLSKLIHEIRSQRRKLKKNLLECDKSDNAEVMIFVSKMFEADELPTQGGSSSKIDHIQLQRERLKKLREERLKQRSMQGQTSLDTSETSVLDEQQQDQQQQTTLSEATSTSESSNADDEQKKSVSFELPPSYTNTSEGDDEEEGGTNGATSTAAITTNKLVAFCRIFSGTIRVGQTLHILGPRYNASSPNEDRTEFKVERLYLLMGRGLECVDSVAAGNVFGMGGVGKHILKTATISSSIYSPIFSSMYIQSIPIVRFAIEPKNLMDMPKLVRGLKLLNQADPSVEVLVQETGEHVIVTAGEVHAERCIRDLNEKFAKVPITVSPPLVSFRETIVEPPQILTTESGAGVSASSNSQLPSIAKKKTANKKWTILIKAIPLPDNIASFIDKHRDDLRAYFSHHDLKRTAVFVTSEVIDQLRMEFVKAGKQWEQEWENLWCLGPRRIGPNILLNHISDYRAPYFEPLHKQISNMLLSSGVKHNETPNDDKTMSNLEEAKEKDPHSIMTLSTTLATPSTTLTPEQQQRVELLKQYDHSFISGFQLATASGPLCDEPMYGVCFCVEDVIFEEKDTVQGSSPSHGSVSPQVNTNDTSISPSAQQSTEMNTALTSPQSITQVTDYSQNDVGGPFTGQIMSAVKSACRKAFDSSPRRLVEAMYHCEIQATNESVGSVCDVLRRRRAKIYSDDMEEGSNLFIIQCYLPVAESFGFAEELRTKTSGAAQPQIAFSHWQILEVDPFYVPTTEDELEEWGERGLANIPNIAKQYIDQVRKRKGLMLDKKIVEFGEKQRTLSKKK
ncbi:hypothetical protein C9374_004420 [Naegleria lovaniensis]|uniref:Ribosome assembly protein 1 n=1 Tax=Naegleria lovaniensis TaxID=51637 RepID=A0AA88GRZ7_NAELO|nr:uncharacterized protein C9374_004420 [Naegleria lovaniensis]KAG2383083.1 hypothetical protein C9374_004420 [Naegleria lovaniensis]